MMPVKNKKSNPFGLSQNNMDSLFLIESINSRWPGFEFLSIIFHSHEHLGFVDRLTGHDEIDL